MNFNDVMMIEGAAGHEAADAREYFAAVQRQINEGNWGLQGMHGCAMMVAIERGECMLGKRRALDYWGNVIPVRDEVEPGTKGSKEYVANEHGDDWADYMEAQ